jgi:hypothetical protein
MKHNFFSKILYFGILSFFFTVLTLQAQRPKGFDYKNERKIFNVKYGESYPIEIIGVNKIDYEYKVKIEFELPKPHTIGGPTLLLPQQKFNLLPSKPDCINKINQALKDRLTRFGQDQIDSWFEELKEFKCEDLTIEIEKENKKEEAGFLIIEENDISKSMLKTKPGGALLITITAKPKKWEVGDDGQMKTKGKIVTSDDLGLDPTPKQDVDNHLKTRTIRINFSSPKGITFSMGPFLAFPKAGHERRKYDRIPNPSFEEGSNDAEKKDKYLIGLTEESKTIYGIAAFWNAPFASIKKMNLGVCWGVAYDMQNKLDKGVNGLLGLYIKPLKSPTLLHLGFAVRQVDDLADGYEIKTAIGENQEIPLKSKIVASFFFSLSFSF